MNNIYLIKHAAAKLYRIKSADLGYANGYFPEMVDHYITPNLPGIISAPISFVAKHPKATLGTAAAIYGGIYGYNKYKDWQKAKEEKKRTLPKVIPNEVIVGDTKSGVPTAVLADESKDTAEVKASSYRKIKRVLNWIYS